jgi:predicted small secreted protein
MSRLRGAHSEFLPGDFNMQKIIVMAALAASLVVAACNTVSGAGRDVSAAGSAVTGAAEEVRN